MPFPGYRNGRFPLEATVQWVGGAEAEVRITCRGWTFVFPGHVPAAELVLALNGQFPKEM